jgi:hypothetical protein
MTVSARDKWERGLVKYDLVEKKMTDLVKDSNLYSGWTLTKKGDKFIYQVSDGDIPADYYIADTDLRNVKRLTDLNPWFAEKRYRRAS